MDSFSQFPYAALGAMFTGLGYLISQVASFRKNSQPIAGITEDRVKVMLAEQEKVIISAVRQILDDRYGA